MKRYVDCRDGTVIDTVYWLMWMQCAIGQRWNGENCIGVPTTFNWDDAMKLKHEFAGYSDWRLPQLNELKAIVAKQKRNPAIDLDVFPSYSTHGFWSDQHNNEGGAWGVRFDRGKVGMFSREDSLLCVRLVREIPEGYMPRKVLTGVPLSPSESEILEHITGAPLSPGESSNYSGFDAPLLDQEEVVDQWKLISSDSSSEPAERVNDNEGLINDPFTGLEWMRCAIGQHWNGYRCTGDPLALTWREALTATMPNRKDWRLPTVEELQSFADGIISSDIDVSGDLLGWSDQCWSSSWTHTLDPHLSHFAWAISVSLDQSIRVRKSITSACHVRLVRVKPDLQESVQVITTIQAFPQWQPTPSTGVSDVPAITKVPQATDAFPTFSIADLMQWLLQFNAITVAELRLRLLPFDLLPSSFIDQINERAIDLNGELALEEVGDRIHVTNEVLMQVVAAWFDS